MSRYCHRILLFSFITVIALFLSKTIYASESKIDSLKNVMENNPTDLQRAEVGYELSQLLFKEDPTAAVSYAEIGIKSALKAEDHQWITTCYHQYGRALLNNNDPERAGLVYQDAVDYELNADPRDEPKLAWVYHNVASYYKRLGNYSTALQYFRRSLKMEEKLKNDRSRASCLLNIGAMHQYMGNIDSALTAMVEAKDLAISLDDTSLMDMTISNLGLIYEVAGNYEKALKMHKTSLSFADSGSYSAAMSYANIGNIFFYQGDMDSTIFYFGRSIEIFEATGSLNELAMMKMNLGPVLVDQEIYDEAVQSYQEAIEFFKQSGNVDFLSAAYLNMGDVTQRQKKYEESMDYFKKALDISLETGNKNNIATAYQNIGVLYEIDGNYHLALTNVKKSLDIFIEMGDKRLVAESYLKLGGLYGLKKQYAEAERNIQNSLKIAEEMNILEVMAEGNGKMVEALLLGQGNTRAYNFHKQHTILMDSLRSESNHKVVQELLTKYELREKADSLKLQQARIDQQAMEHDKNLVITKQKSIQLGIALVGLLISLALGIYAFINYRKKQAANEKLVVQNEIIEQKNEEILDSITYAKRIQDAILPPTKLVKSYLNESFILYRPKDIVAGDFYWFDVQGDVVYFAVADCTGHGVPGAMVSVVCANALKKVVGEMKYTSPSTILDTVKTIVVETFERSEEKVEDGMDISFCKLHLKDRKLEFAGAHNSLYRITDLDENVESVKFKTESRQLIEYKGDKQPIGKFTHDNPFTQQSIQLKEGDKIYLTSDGFPDQFGGEKNKKFMYKSLKNLFLKIHNDPMDSQKENLSQTFEAWMGDQEQVDDVCIIGVGV